MSYHTMMLACCDWKDCANTHVVDDLPAPTEAENGWLDVSVYTHDSGGRDAFTSLTFCPKHSKMFANRISDVSWYADRKEVHNAED